VDEEHSVRDGLSLRNRQYDYSDDLVIYSLPSLSSQFNYLLLEPCQIYLWYIGFIVMC